MNEVTKHPKVIQVMARVTDADTCVEWPFGKFNSGYGAVKHRGRTYKAHRVLFEAHYGREPGPGMVVCHSCDNRGCVNPHHLFEGTPGDNMRDKVAKGRQSRGRDLPQTKITERDVIEVVRRLNRGERQTALALKFGISQSRISAIATGQSWSWVTGIQRSG